MSRVEKSGPSSGGARMLDIKWDAGQGFYVPGLKTVQCNTLEQMLQVRVRVCVRAHSHTCVWLCVHVSLCVWGGDGYAVTAARLVCAACSTIVRAHTHTHTITITITMLVINTSMKHRNVGSHELNIESARYHSTHTIHCAQSCRHTNTHT